MAQTGGTFNGTHLRVTALNWPPWLKLNCDDPDRKNLMYGPMANMIEVLSQKGGFTYDIACPEEGGTGMVFPNGSWTGLVGDLYRNRADLALGPMSITYDRIGVVHLTPQIITEYLTILAGFPDRMEISAFGTLMVFSWQVWLALFCGLVVCVFASVLADTANSICRGHRRMRQILQDNWWMYISALFMEPPIRTPHNTPGRLVLAVWWLTILVLMNAFTGHMKATMMLSPDPERIDSFSDLSRKTDITPFLWGGGAYEDLLKKSNRVKEYRLVWNMIVKRDGLRDEAQLYDDANLRMVLEGNAVIISDYTTMLFHASRTCRMHLAAGRYYFAKEPTFPTPLAMAVDRRVDPELRQFINRRVSWLFESGVLKAWIEKQLGDWQSCLLGHHEEKYSPLSVSEIQSVFFLFLTFASFSIVAFISEVLIGAYMKEGARRYPVRRITWVTRKRTASQGRRNNEV